ncbi:Putative nucleoside phosphorylase superfamily [Septoria linicola]|uniref:Nucleoside phosphorylase superfamily n=1 Tax=Septoria linicola TaxID=215465 RepID=A0A9Q9AWF7_9PEZI|nr:putative nucleoside phosphorylase superfamily [Septoria linicola]USW53076.1 Putative nucleoside phosphorylase superfamily [Septoria linicola]
MSATRTQHDYTIGIICALSLERTALEAMLDGCHDIMPCEPGDTNTYTFGATGKHNVVIACLGFGDSGMISASVVADNLRRSYPSIKLGFMVGIAGAAPHADDESGGLFLGDVVVGCIKGVPSVINFSLGKETTHGFDIRSELAEPPLALQTVVSALEAAYQGSGPTYLNQLQDNIGGNPYLDRKPLSKDYFNMPETPDVLNATTDTSEFVPRKPRFLRDPPPGLEEAKFITTLTGSDNEIWFQYPVVHYGTIACSDTLIQSGAERERVHRLIKDQRKADVLCFETEAAGVVKDWPCLVIRGLSHYADEHQDQAWQNFAAATAAAYARNLLLRLAPQVVGSRGSVKGGERVTLLRDRCKRR